MDKMLFISVTVATLQLLSTVNVSGYPVIKILHIDLNNVKDVILVDKLSNTGYRSLKGQY